MDYDLRTCLNSSSCRVGTAHHQRGYVARREEPTIYPKLIRMVGSAHPTITVLVML